MINILEILFDPQMNPEKYFEVMRDFRKGGLNPEMYTEFIETIKQLPSLGQRRTSDFHIFDRFNLVDISEQDFAVIMREMQRRGIQKSKKCWHPEASPTTCNIDAEGDIIVSAAHSIQNNGVLSKIVENGHVMGYSLDKVPFDGKNSEKITLQYFGGSVIHMMLSSDQLKSVLI